MNLLTRIINKLFQIVLAVIVIFGISLIVIPAFGIIAGLVKRWLA